MSKVWKKIGKQQAQTKQQTAINEKNQLQKAQNIKKIQLKQSKNKQLKQSMSQNADSRKSNQKNQEQSSNLSYSGESIQIANFLDKNSRQSLFKNQNGNKSVCIEFQIQENRNLIKQQPKQKISYSLNQVKKQVQGIGKNISGSSSIQIFIHQMKNLTVNSQKIVQVDEVGDDLPKLKFNEPSEIINERKFIVESGQFSDDYQQENSLNAQSINHVKSFTRINKKLGSSSESFQHQKNISKNNKQQQVHESIFSKINMEAPNFIANSKIIQSQGDQFQQSQAENSQVLQQISLRPTQQIGKSIFVKPLQPQENNTKLNSSAQNIHQKTQKQSFSSLNRKQFQDKDMCFVSNTLSDKIMKSDIIQRKNNIEQDIQIRYSNRSNCHVYQNDPIAQQKQSNQDSISIIGKDLSGQNSKSFKKGKIHLNIKPKNKNTKQIKKQDKSQKQKDKAIINQKQIKDCSQKFDKEHKSDFAQLSEQIMKISGIKSNKKLKNNQQGSNVQSNQSLSHPMIKNTNQFMSSSQQAQELQLSTNNILTKKQFNSQNTDNKTEKKEKFLIEKESNNVQARKYNCSRQIQSPSISKQIQKNQLGLDNYSQKENDEGTKMKKDFIQNTEINLEAMNKLQRQKKAYNVLQLQYEKLRKQFQSKNQEIYFYQKQVESYKLKIQGFLQQISQLEDQKCSLQEQVKELKQCIYNSSPQFYRDFNIQNEQLRDKIKQMELQIKNLKQKNFKYQQNDQRKTITNSMKLSKQKSRSSNKVNLTGCFNLQQHNQSQDKMSIQSKIDNVSRNSQFKQYKSFHKNEDYSSRQKLTTKIQRQLFPSLSIQIAFPSHAEIILNCQENRLKLQQYIFDLQQKIVWMKSQTQQKSKQIYRRIQVEIQAKFKAKYKQIIETMKLQLKKIKKKYDKLTEYVQKQIISSSQKLQQSYHSLKKNKKQKQKNQYKEMQTLMKNVEGFQKFINFVNMFNQGNNQNSSNRNQLFLGQIKEPTIDYKTTGFLKKSNQNQSQKQQIKKQAIQQIYGIKQNQKNIQQLYGTLQNQWRLIQSQKKQFFNQKRFNQPDQNEKPQSRNDEVYHSNTSIRPKDQFRKFTSQVNESSNQVKYNQINDSRSQTRYYSPQSNFNKHRAIYPSGDFNYGTNYQRNQNRDKLERKHSPNYHINYGRVRQQKYNSPTKKYYEMKPTKPYLDQQDFLGLSSKLNKLRNNLNQQLNSIK